MGELLDKLSSYYIFNHLVPGVVFAVFAHHVVGYDFIQDDIIISVFTCYFIGLVISRFGSTVLEPCLKKIGFVQFADYTAYTKALETDPEIRVLSEANNSYRTYSAGFILLVFLGLYKITSTKYQWLSDFGIYLLIAALLVMFLFAYRKQTRYILMRIKKT